MRPTAVTGVVLCGGRSRRMGTDKARVELGGRTLLDHAIAALGSFCDPVLLASGTEARYPEAGLRMVLDRCAEAGPLAGLEAGLGAAETEWIAALACDMPRADPRLHARLLERAVELDLDACLLESETGREPLCGIYRRSCRPAMQAALEAGFRRVIDFERFPAGGRALRVGWLGQDDLEPALAWCAVNVNTPDDLARERELGRHGEETA